jgi:subtilisin family serine protease
VEGTGSSKRVMAKIVKLRSLAAIFFSIAAATMGACGGGGGGSSMPPPPTITPHPLTCNHTFSAARMSLGLARAGQFGLHPPRIEPETTVSGKLAVRFSGGRISAQAALALARLGAHQEGGMNPHGAVTFSIPRSVRPQAAAAALRGVRGIAAAGPVVIRNLLDVTPNDPDFNAVQQWDMYAIKMPMAWGITKGLSTVKIAVIDTGYDTGNPDLVGKVDASIVFDKPIGSGAGTPDVGASIEDQDGHGSDVSGIAAANTNNSMLIAGTGWNVHLMEARVFPYGGGSASANTQNIAAAIDWAVNNGARVINLSLGSSTPDATYEEPAVAGAIRSGVIVVAASGNGIMVGGDSVGQPTLDYPAADPGVVSVGASAYCDSAKNIAGSGFEYVASYSNFSRGLSVVAPGADPDDAQLACSTSGCLDFLQWIENLDSLQGMFHETLGLFAGTSMAAPHVAGAAALMVSKNSTLTPAQVLSILKASADNISDSRQGSGRLNVFNALNQTP